jgi:hypothetical protein
VTEPTNLRIEIVTGHVVQPGDRLLLTFGQPLTPAQADQIRGHCYRQLGVEAIVVGNCNGVMILPPDWQPPETDAEQPEATVPVLTARQNVDQLLGRNRPDAA